MNKSQIILEDLDKLYEGESYKEGDKVKLIGSVFSGSTAVVTRSSKNTVMVKLLDIHPGVKKEYVDKFKDKEIPVKATFVERMK